MKVKLLTPTAKAPVRSTEGAAGYDLFADVHCRTYAIPDETIVVSTGVSVKIPDGHVGLIQPRSGLAFDCALDTMAGVIDQDYTGEIKVLLTIHDVDLNLLIKHGMRIAQLVVVPCLQHEIEVVDELDKTERGNKGFGHTGTF